MSGVETPTDGGEAERIQWQTEIGKRIPFPAIEAGSVYVGSTSGVYAFAAADGTLFASFTERTGRGDVEDDDTTLYAVDAAGTETWRFARSCEGFSCVGVSEGTVFVAGRYGDGMLYALASET